MTASKLVGGIVAIAVVCTWAYVALSGEPRLQIGVANGTYSNRCCGSVVLNNGLMTVANHRIRYVIEQDKAGPYVLPKAYVGASKNGLMIKSASYALKLRLDVSARPHEIELPDDQPDGEVYPFVREKGS